MKPKKQRLISQREIELGLVTFKVAKKDRIKSPGATPNRRGSDMK